MGNSSASFSNMQGRRDDILAERTTREQRRQREKDQKELKYLENLLLYHGEQTLCEKTAEIVTFENVPSFGISPDA